MRKLAFAGVVVAWAVGGAAAPAAAQDVPGLARVVSATLKKITTPQPGKLDNMHKVIATPTGFLLTYSRSAASAPPFTLYTQRYNATGVPVGAPLLFDNGIVGDHVVMTRTGPNTAVAAWNANAQVKVANLNLVTGVVSGARLIGKSNDHIHDIARLSNGNIAVVTPQVAALPLPSKYRVSLKILSPALAPVKEWQSVHGAGWNLDAWAYYDQTLVARATGGTVLYRDHVTSRIMGRNFDNAGTLGSLVQVSTTAFAPFQVGDIAYLQIKAATLTNGKVAACWVATQATVNRYDVRCRVLSPAGAPVGPGDILVASALNQQYSPNVVALPGGKFTVTWVNQVGFTPHVRYRSYNAAGALPVPVFAERTGVVTTTFAMSPVQSDSALLADGSLVTVISQDTFVTGLRAFGIARPGQ